MTQTTKTMVELKRTAAYNQPGIIFERIAPTSANGWITVRGADGFIRELPVGIDGYIIERVWTVAS